MNMPQHGAVFGQAGNQAILRVAARLRPQQLLRDIAQHALHSRHHLLAEQRRAIDRQQMTQHLRRRTQHGLASRQPLPQRRFVDCAILGQRRICIHIPLIAYSGLTRR